MQLEARGRRDAQGSVWPAGDALGLAFSSVGGGRRSLGAVQSGRNELLMKNKSKSNPLRLSAVGHRRNGPFKTQRPADSKNACGKGTDKDKQRLSLHALSLTFLVVFLQFRAEDISRQAPPAA